MSELTYNCRTTKLSDAGTVSGEGVACAVGSAVTGRLVVGVLVGESVGELLVGESVGALVGEVVRAAEGCDD